MPHDPRFPVQRVYNYPYPQGVPQPVPVPPYPSDAQQGRSAYQVSLGQPAPSRLRDDPAFDDFQKVPAFYTVTVVLGGAAGAEQAESTPLRPEAFICERITWACNETPSQYGGTGVGVSIGGSPQGRAVRISWADEFTRFMGKNPCMLSALFGDGDGFLNLPRGILFQGRQTLTAALARISDPTNGALEPELEFDFSFQGVGLFPKNVAQSGSAG